MRETSPLTSLWRRKWLVAAVFAIVVVTAGVISTNLEDIYETQSTLLVSVPSTEQSFDTVQASQALARSYADIIDSPNLARLVADRLRPRATPSDVSAASNFEPVAETQLLKITASGPDPRRVKAIADTYATTFIAYADRNLAPNTKAIISLADPAPPPGDPIRPQPRLYVLVAAILGLALGSALALLRDRLDHRLRTAEEIESQFETPVLARIPRRRRSEGSRSTFDEAFRVLRTNLQFATPEGRPRSIAITSATEGEGKTTIVAALAAVNLERVLKVVAVEADLRRPALQKAILPDGPGPLQPGLSNYLARINTLPEVLHPIDDTGLTLIPSGPLPPNPSAILDAEGGRLAVSDILADANLVLIDCPPLSVAADASLISRWVDAVIVVVDVSRSTSHGVRDALRQLEAVKAPVIGLVVNRDRSGEGSGGSSYYGSRSSVAEPDVLEPELPR